VRVLHVHSGNIWGGIETFLATLVRHEGAAPEMRTTVALAFDGPVAERLRAAGAEVHVLPEVRLSRPATAGASQAALTRLMAHERPDIVVIHSTWTAAAFGPALARSRVPVAVWAHAPDPGPRWQRWLARRCPLDLLIANSRYTLAARPRDARQVRVECVYYPVGSQAPRAARARTRAAHGVTDDVPVLLVAARLEPWKGHSLLFEALARLPARLDWRCWIAGGAQTPSDAAHERTLRDACARAGLAGRVSFLGQRDDVPELMEAADVYCQPNLGPEPFGISFVEALWAGLPVVSTRIGALPEIVDDTCGRLTGPRDADHLAATLSALVDDRALRRALAAAGPARAAALCEPSAQVRAIERLLASIRPVPSLTVAQ
jgi:glycosyltransferase involved in cell wall biosynthesis